jgi:hypothetical protein
LKKAKFLKKKSKEDICMSKPNENDQQGNSSADSAPASGKGKDVLTIEEHKKNLNISAPVFAAVMQSKNWGSGKKVPEAVFKKAVEEFLGAPMGGTVPKGGN